jgi:membrane dipeptidase
MQFRLFDAHCDTVLRIVDKGEDITKETNAGHIDLPRLKKANFGCQVFACYTSVDQYGDKTPQRSRTLVDAIHRLTEHPDFVMPETAEELKELRKSTDKVGIIISIEGGEALGGRPEAVGEMHELGIRSITLAWGDNNLTGSSFGSGAGLTDVGRDVVAEMQNFRMIPDMSHISDAAFEDVFECFDGPIIASHSNCREICPSPRNLTDDQIRAIAERGGAVGAVFTSGFINKETAQAQNPIYKKYFDLAREAEGKLEEYLDMAHAEMKLLPRPPLEDVINHIDRVVNIGGIETAAFGSDFDGYAIGPSDLEDCTDMPRLVGLLEKRGYPADEIDRICWGNWERVFGWSLT